MSSEQQPAAEEHPPTVASIELSLAKEQTRILSIPVEHKVTAQDEQQNTSAASKGGCPPSVLHKFCRMLGLESFYIMIKELGGPPVLEEKKIVITQGFLAVYQASLFHIIPFAASIALVVLNFKGCYIGGELTGPIGQDNLRLLGLQVAAKLMELVVVASLSSIMFALLRRQLIDEKLPFGAITAGFEFSKISFLWSKEFVATCGGKFKSGPVKTLVLSTIVVFTLLSVAIGPAAAVSSQPALRNWPAGGTTFYLNSTLDGMFPLVLDKAPQTAQICSANITTSCFHSNYRLIADELLSHWPVGPSASSFMPENTLISGQHTLRNLGVRFRGPFVYHPALSSVTVPVAAIADAVTATANYWTLADYDICHRRKGGFCNYNDIFFSVETSQPVTYVACLAGDVGSRLQFQNVQPLTANPQYIVLENSALRQQDWFEAITLNRTTTAVEWISLPQTNTSRSSIGAIVAIPKTAISTTPDQVLACTIDARWANATVTGSFWKGPRVVSGFPIDWSSAGREQMSKGNLTWPLIEISPAWAEHLNPSVDAFNTSAFSMLAQSLGRANDITQVTSVNTAVEAILGVMLADGLSRIGSEATIQGNLKDNWRESILPVHVYGKGGSAFNHTVNPSDGFANFQMLVTVNGYGYGFTVATLLSCIVLLVYSTIVFLFVANTVWSRRSSSSWESISEMLALAVNSKPSEALQNTSAGIQSLVTLKESVRIGCNGEHLEMIFGKYDDRVFERTSGEEDRGEEGAKETLKKVGLSLYYS